MLCVRHIPHVANVSFRGVYTLSFLLNRYCRLPHFRTLILAKFETRPEKKKLIVIIIINNGFNIIFIFIPPVRFAEVPNISNNRFPGGEG